MVLEGGSDVLKFLYLDGHNFFDVVKIDRSFLKDLGENEADENIVAIPNCEMLQGYLFSRPVEARKRRPRPDANVRQRRARR